MGRVQRRSARDEFWWRVGRRTAAAIIYSIVYTAGAIAAVAVGLLVLGLINLL